MIYSFPLSCDFTPYPHALPVVSGFGGDKGQAIMMDCLENGDVIMNAFNANDCTGNVTTNSSHRNSSSSSSHFNTP